MINLDLKLYSFDEKDPPEYVPLLVGSVTDHLGELEWHAMIRQESILMLPLRDAPIWTLENARFRKWRWAELPEFTEQIDEAWRREALEESE